MAMDDPKAAAKPEPDAKKPPHPLVSDRETKLFRYATHDDIRRWEIMEFRYTNLLAALKQAVEDGLS